MSHAQDPSEPLDARGDRAVQATLGVLLLAAFVFRQTWAVPVLLLITGVGAFLGPSRNPFHAAYRRWLAAHIRGQEGTVPAATVQAQDQLSALVLAAATLLFVLGLPGLGWFLAIGAAIVAIVAATTLVHLGTYVHLPRPHR
ncbi:MAG TPA: DUF4395 family protein [Acidimicrobiia bacterium]|nr:DUF4395 family protein [Acidimicrobiia bacterium]